MDSDDAYYGMSAVHPLHAIRCFGLAESGLAALEEQISRSGHQLPSAQSTGATPIWQLAPIGSH